MSENYKELKLKEIAEENPTETLSSFRSLTVTTQTSSSVILQWIYERPQPICESSKELVFKLLKLETRDEWKAIAWTRKTTCTIDNLEQNVCYSLQLLLLVEDEDEFKLIDESEIFKVVKSIRQDLRKFLFSQIFSVLNSSSSFSQNFYSSDSKIASKSHQITSWARTWFYIPHIQISFRVEPSSFKQWFDSGKAAPWSRCWCELWHPRDATHTSSHRSVSWFPWHGRHVDCTQSRSES